MSHLIWSVDVNWRLVAILMFCVLTLVGCRSRLGGTCKTKSDCALGLYCDADRKVCEDRGKLLKKQAEEIYVYPIPAPAPKTAKPGQPTVVPTQ